MNGMNIIVDAFGGDNAPLEIIKGCVEAVAEYNINVTLTGDETKIKNVFSENSLSMDNIDICHCTQKITMEDSAESVLKEKKDSSMAVGLCLLNEGKGDAFVSAGNSGALCVGATLAIKRIKGIKRPAFAPVMPSESGFFMLMDGGANVECRPEMLYQFAVMGSIYMEKVMGIKNPRVGLANVGAEEHKGTELYRNTHELLQNSNLNFIGNVEGRDIPNGVCDVVVCDGFTGNLILKTYEGVALVMMNQIKNMFMGSVKGKLAAGLVMKDLKNMKTHFDYNRYGGAPILGASKPVFKAHGSAKAVTVKNAIRLSVEYVKANAIEAICCFRSFIMEDLQKRIGYTFKNTDLLTEALTHSSYANEHKAKHIKYNERLEFLGDAVLSIVVSDYIFKHCPELPEGELTKLRASLVCEKTLFEFAKQIELGKYLVLSKGERNNGGAERPSILSDAFEALIAAIYIDGGIDPASKHILNFVIPAIKNSKKKKLNDYKTALQEIIQKNPGEQLEYVLVGESGPDHNKHFVVEVHLNSNVIGKGGGRSKKEAEQQAAREALELMGY